MAGQIDKPPSLERRFCQGRPVAGQRPSVDKGSALAIEQSSALHSAVTDELGRAFEGVGRLVDFDGRGGLRAGAVGVKRARIDFHASRINHGHALLRCGVNTLALFGEQGQGVQRNQGNLKGLTQALGRRHPNAQTGERTGPTRHRHGIQVGVGPTLLVKHGVDEGHESLGMDVSLLGALLFPGDRRSAFGQRHRALGGGGFDQENFGHHFTSTSSPCFKDRLTTSYGPVTTVVPTSSSPVMAT